MDEAAEALERRLFFEQLSGRYEELLKDPTSWAEIAAERTSERPSLRDRSV